MGIRQVRIYHMIQFVQSYFDLLTEQLIFNRTEGAEGIGTVFERKLKSVVGKE